jgi:hypothetical protein
MGPKKRLPYDRRVGIFVLSTRSASIRRTNQLVCTHTCQTTAARPLMAQSPSNITDREPTNKARGAAAAMQIVKVVSGQAAKKLCGS